MSRILTAALMAMATVACRVSLSPLQNRIDVGRETFVVFVGDGEGGLGDLYAVKADGGSVYPVTYTRLHETRPALSPNGAMVAFLRGRRAGDSTDYRVVVMNLLNGAERVVFTGEEDRAPVSLGWHRSNSMLYVATTGGVLEATLPPEPLTITPAVDSAVADSSVSILLGSPAFARVAPCSTGVGVCFVPRLGQEQPIAEATTGIARWGGDSVAYVTGTRFSVRPLGGGRSRALRWVDPPANARLPTVFSLGEAAGQRDREGG
jgi:hypothetical protein